MRLQSVLAECFRNYVRGSSRALPLALVMFAIIVTPAELEMSTAADLTARTRQYELAGASTYIINAPRSVNAAACDALTGTGAVSAAGALRTDIPVALDVLPAQDLPVYKATPGFLTLAGLPEGTATHPGAVVIARSIWDSVRGPEDDDPPTGRDLPPLSVATVYEWPVDGRSQSLGSAVLAPSPGTEPFDQCWVRAADPTTDPRWILPGTLEPVVDPNQVRVAQLNPTLGQQLNTPDQFAARSSQRAAQIAGLAAFLLAASAVWARRVQIGAAREFGMDPLTAVTSQSLEAAAWWLTGVVFAAPVVIWRAHLLSTADQSDLLQLVTPILAATMAGVISGTAAITLMTRRRSVTDLLRTR